MFYEVCIAVATILFFILISVKRIENKVIFSFTYTILLGAIVYMKVGMITALIIVMVDLITKLVLLAYLTDFSDELSFKLFYKPKVKITLFLTFAILLSFVGLSSDSVGYVHKKMEF